MALCKGVGSRRVKLISLLNRWPLKDDAHTEFFVDVCLDCGGVCGFPQENFDLALETGTIETKETLNDIIERGHSV
ncbi:unnamed protein product [marine sediment metagenome]|uniref:Uncharacterized protein n=1 Tax=marine sediment metagenome TaxID=412755 RepID=X1I9D9_9ZZZZ